MGPGHMSDTVRTRVSKGAEAAPARRIEVFTGAGRRRNWSAEDKAVIIAESYSSDDTVCAVARRHGLTPAQLFAWRRAARGVEGTNAVSSFVPAVVEETAPLAENERPKRAPRSAGRPARMPGIVEVEIDGVTVRVGRGAEAKTIAAVIKALKAAS